MNQMKRHSYDGYKIVKGIGHAEDVAKIILQHHEKIDRSGYPRKLKEEQLKHNSQIIAVADIYSALISKRSYKDKLSQEESLEIIQNIKINSQYIFTLISLLK